MCESVNVVCSVLIEVTAIKWRFVFSISSLVSFYGHRYWILHCINLPRIIMDLISNLRMKWGVFCGISEHNHLEGWTLSRKNLCINRSKFEESKPNYADNSTLSV